MIRFPSVDRIEDFTKCDRETAIKVRRVLDGRDDPMQYPKTAKWAHSCYSDPRSLDLQLEAVNELLDTHGIEAIRSESVWDRYFGDTVALYCNAGDTYYGTILYDIDRGVFYATTYGDWIETAGRNGRYTFT